MRKILALGLLAAAGALAGCGGGQLETGYQYTPLGASPTQRQAFYADPFSPQAREAAVEAEEQFRARRPD